MSFGRLDRPSGSQPMSDINMTPLIDVMLVLLVIFMITAPLLASGIKLELPRSSTPQAKEPLASVTLALDREGTVFLNDRAIRPPELALALAQTASRNPDTEVQLRADQSVAYGRVVELMDVAQKAGLSRIGFVTDPAAAKPSDSSRP
ncbi:MAG: ExbD/TolR family protein [Burkholderiaceae bacterium]